MPTVSLKAHYDGQQILLDEPFNLPPNARLIVTVLPDYENEDREEWRLLAQSALAGAYGDDEPDYGPADVVRR